MCSSIVLYLTFISDNSLPFYAWKQEWVYIFYVASITEKKNRYHDLPSCIIMTCDRHLPLLSHVICHLLSHVICHCHFTSSAIVVSCHLPLSSHIICICHLSSSAIVVSRHLSLLFHVICCLTSAVIVISRHLPLSSHVICYCCLTSSVSVVSRHLPLSTLSRHLPLSTLSRHLPLSTLSRHLPLSSHVICHWHLTVVNFTTSLTTFEVIYLSSTTFSIIVYRCAFACLFSLKLIFFLLDFHLCIGYFTIVILCVSWDRQHMFFLKNIVNQTIINSHQR